MRELEFIPGAGGDGELVFADADGERFRVPLGDALREAVAASGGSAGAAPAGDSASGADQAAQAAPGGAADSPAGAAHRADDGDAADAPGISRAPGPRPGDAPADSPAPAAPADPAPPRPAIAAVRDERPVRRLRPREIQDRVRAGASVQDIVEETGMDARQVEPFAWPVLGERHRIAQLGRDAHPQRSDGPAPLTLAEVVATAFAARDLDPAEARWDARRDPAGQWIVSVSWTAGLSDNTAEWSFHPASAGESAAVSRNALAAELVDPDYARSTPFGARRDEIADDRDDDDEVPEEFLRHPDDDEPRRRRRKTVMPSWEDVLLGVRPTDRK
ncbi:septation protein SepH [Corynebacterium sp. 335C]